MTRKRTTMSTIQEILRLKKLGHSKAKTARILGINRETVRKLWNSSLEDYSETGEIPSWAKKIDWENFYKERRKVPTKILYQELGETIKLPSYQAFCQYLRNHKPETTPLVALKQQRTPGQSIEVDYSGDSPNIFNPTTGEICNTDLFVGSLSYSSYFYAEFTFSQKLEDFIRSHCNMFTYFGGVADFIIPDNCKTAVSKTHKYDPTINSTYQDMCRYYGIVVDPADPRSPTHKPNVENAVKYIQTDFLSRIRKRRFTSLIDLNGELHTWLKSANEKKIKGRGESRSFFFKREKLHPLPLSPYQIFSFKKAKVHPDCHFQHQKNYYSIPHQYVGKEIDVKFNDKTIHAYFNGNLIATHPTLKGTHHWSTNHAHFPEKKYVDLNYHLLKAQKEAEKVGENTSVLINRLLKESRHPLKVLRKIQGILRLSKKYSQEIMEYACEQALEFNRFNYDNINRFAKNYSTKPNNQSAPARQLELIYLQEEPHERND